MNNATAELEKIAHKVILQPLSVATQQLFTPIRVEADDYLEIELDKSGKHFITQATRFTPYSFDNGGNYYIVNGIKQYKNGTISINLAYNWQKRIPERKELGYGKWSFACTDFTVLTIHHIWPKEKLIFKGEDAKLLYLYLLTRFFSQAHNAVMGAKFKSDGVVPHMPDDFVEHPDLPLADYQKVALLSCIGQESFGLLMEQGTGKTPIVINRICLEGRRKREEHNNMYRVLVICPNQVRLNWKNELKRFSWCPGKYGVLRGPLFKRMRTLHDVVMNDPKYNWAVAIISIDSVCPTIDPLKLPAWDLIVIDESHYIKSGKTNRTKSCLQFNDLRYKQRMILTGTPIANSVFDLYTQLEFLGQGLSGFTTFRSFSSFHGIFASNDKVKNPIQKLIGIRGLPLLQERLARLTYMTTKQEAGLKLPDKVYSISEVEMTTPQSKLYEKLRRELVVEIEEILSAPTTMDKAVTINHILTRLLRLAQITSGHIKWDEEQVSQIPGGNPKVKEFHRLLRTDILKDPLSKCIVWCTFVEDLRILSKTLDLCNIKHSGYHNVIQKKYKYKDSFAAQSAFNCDPDIKVFVANPASAGEGLNIIGYDTSNEAESKTYTSHVVYFSSNWSMIQRAQSEDRAHRRGTRTNVHVIDIVVPGTIDEEIRARVMEKRQTATMVQDVREILEMLKKG
jgi:hypothetical protein